MTADGRHIPQVVIHERCRRLPLERPEHVGGGQPALLEGDLAEAVSDLKAKPGKNIGMSGSATLVRSLLELGLVDELRLLVHPLVVGSGAKLFENGTAPVSLELVDSRTFSTGVLDLTYRPVAA